MRIAWELLDEVRPELRDAIEAQLNRIRTADEPLSSVQLVARTGAELGAGAEVRVTASIGKRKIVVARQSESKQRALMLAVAALEATLRRLLGTPLPMPPVAEQPPEEELLEAPPLRPQAAAPAAEPEAAPIDLAAATAVAPATAAPAAALRRPTEPAPAVVPAAAPSAPRPAALPATTPPLVMRPVAAGPVPARAAPPRPAVQAPVRAPVPAQLSEAPHTGGLSFNQRMNMVIEAVSPDREAMRRMVARSWEGARSALTPAWLARRQEGADSALSVEVVRAPDRDLYDAQDFSGAGDPLLETRTVVETTVVETRRTVVETRRLVELRNRGEKLVTPPRRALSAPARTRWQFQLPDGASWERLWRPTAGAACALAAGVALFSAWQYQRGLEPAFSDVANGLDGYSATAEAPFTATSRAPLVIYTAQSMRPMLASGESVNGAGAFGGR